jgi:hypothetical protein
MQTTIVNALFGLSLLCLTAGLALSQLYGLVAAIVCFAAALTASGLGMLPKCSACGYHIAKNESGLWIGFTAGTCRNCGNQIGSSIPQPRITPNQSKLEPQWDDGVGQGAIGALIRPVVPVWLWISAVALSFMGAASLGTLSFYTFVRADFIGAFTGGIFFLLTFPSGTWILIHIAPWRFTRQLRIQHPRILTVLAILYILASSVVIVGLAATGRWPQIVLIVVASIILAGLTRSYSARAQSSDGT